MKKYEMTPEDTIELEKIKHKWQKYGPTVYQMLDAGLHLNAAAARLCINKEQAVGALRLYCKYNNLPDPRRGAIRLFQIRNKNEDTQYTIEEHGPKWHKMHVDGLNGLQT